MKKAESIFLTKTGGWYAVNRYVKKQKYNVDDTRISALVVSTFHPAILKMFTEDLG